MENDRKESQSSIIEVTESKSVEAPGVEIFVQRPSVTETGGEDDVKSNTSAPEDDSNSIKSTAEAEEDSTSIKSVNEDDRRSIISIKSINAEERKSVTSITQEDNKLDKDEDTQSVKSMKSIKSNVEADEDSVSIFAGIGEDSKVDYQAGEKVSEFVLYKKFGEDEEDIVGNYQIVDQGVIVSKRNADNISVLSFAVTEAGDNVSLRSVTIEKKEGDDDEEEEGVDDDCDGDSVKTLTEGEEKEVRVDATNGVVYTNDDSHDEISIHPDDEDDRTEIDDYKSSQVTEDDRDRESIKSYSVHGDYILSLHQRVGAQSEMKAPVPKPRSGSGKAMEAGAELEDRKEEQDDAPGEEAASVSNYEEERSRVDFDHVVREAMNRNRETHVKTGVDALEKEEGEDRPNIAALLAWAKGTKDPNQTRTFVVRKRDSQESTPPQRQHSYNLADEDFEVIIQEKERPVTKTAENGVTKISTGKKTFEVAQQASTFEVSIMLCKRPYKLFSGPEEKCYSTE